MPPRYEQPAQVGGRRHEELSALAEAYWNNPDRLAALRAALDDSPAEAALFDMCVRVNAQRGADGYAELVRYEAERLRVREDAADRHAEEKGSADPLSWARVAHAAAMEALRARSTMPEIGHMADSPKLETPPLPILYAGKINDVHGSTSAGKSWFAIFLAVQEMKEKRKHVAYLDFEDDAAGIYERFLRLGATEALLEELLHYHNPQHKLTRRQLAAFTSGLEPAMPRSLAIVDATTESMAVEGLDPNSGTDVAAWHNLVTRPLAAAGWGVLVIDHTPHEASRQSGSQHKKSSITGVSYFLESIKPFVPGEGGKSRLWCTEKDRPGWVKANSAPSDKGSMRWYGDFTLKPVGASGEQGAIWPWRSQQQEGAMNPLERLVLEFLEREPGASWEEVMKGIGRRKEDVRATLNTLIRHGLAAKERDGHSYGYYLTPQFETCESDSTTGAANDHADGGLF